MFVYRYQVDVTARELLRLRGALRELPGRSIFQCLRYQLAVIAFLSRFKKMGECIVEHFSLLLLSTAYLTGLRISQEREVDKRVL